jgi:hypothetical protein
MRRFHLLSIGFVPALFAAGCPTNTRYEARALTSTGSLVSFNTGDPATLEATVAVSGLPAGETLEQIRYRPADGLLYGVTSANHVGRVDPASGVVTLVGAAAFDSGVLADPVMAVDPVADELRLVSPEVNLRVSPATGALVAIGAVTFFAGADPHAGAVPQLAAAAYDHTSTSTSTLYALDVGTASLVQLGDALADTTASVDTGTLHTIGALGTPFSVNGGFDIEQKNGDAFAVLTPGGAPSALYTVNLSLGTATLVGTLGGGTLTVISLAIVPD